jgi:hypothetical protein
MITVDSDNDDDFDIFMELGVGQPNIVEQSTYADPLDAFMDDEIEQEDSVEDLLRILAQEEIASDSELLQTVQDYQMELDVNSVLIKRDRDAYHLLLELTDSRGEKIRPFATVLQKEDSFIGLTSPKNLPEQWKELFTQLLKVLQSIMKKQFNTPSI